METDLELTTEEAGEIVASALTAAGLDLGDITNGELEELAASLNSLPGTSSEDYVAIYNRAGPVLRVINARQRRQRICRLMFYRLLVRSGRLTEWPDGMPVTSTEKEA